MSITTLSSPYRLGLNPLWAALNQVSTGGVPIFARLPAAAVTPNWSDIWPGASLTAPIATRTLPTVGFTLGLVSDSANDAAAGSGATAVLVSYLDTNYIQQVWQAVPTGTSILVGPANALRVNSAQVVGAGAGGGNAGNIYIVDSSTSAPAGVPSTTTKVFDVIPVGYNTDGLGMYTVPAGFQLSILHINTGITNGTATTYEGRVRIGIALYSGNPPGGTLLPFQWVNIASPSDKTPNDDFRFDLPIVLTPGSELRFQGSSTPLGGEIVLTAEAIQTASPAITAQGNA